MKVIEIINEALKEREVISMRKETFINAAKILKEEGPIKFCKHTVYHIDYMHKKRKNLIKHGLKDVLFINGCPIDYCERYRVLHKMEELTAYGLSSDETVPELLNESMIKCYRAFVIYRTPWSSHVDTFIKLAKENNKVVFYDIDDLVFDLEYTKDIKGLKSLTKEQREEYDDGVRRYGKLLDCCDYAITTTKVIANEMKKHVKDVCIDKNIASLKMQKYSELAIKNVERDSDKIVIGYASGSLTHNADFDIIKDDVKKILDKYENVYLKFIGVITVPDEFREYGDRILTSPFVDYKKLPEVIRSLDINLAPLEDTFFNTAKSSIKWMEAGLVSVPTVASNVGDFHDCITDGVDGFLCKDNEWFKKLEKLVVDSDLRQKMGEAAYNTVHAKFTSNRSGKTVADFIKSKLHKNVMFIIPAANVSGGVIVATKHAAILKKHGYDVTMLNMDLESQGIHKLYDKDTYIHVVPNNNLIADMHIDMLVATMWFTTMFAKSYHKCKRIKYLVQGKEDGFYEPDKVDILLANASYNLDNVEYLTISKWCQGWLKDEYDKEAKYAPNGIDLSIFTKKKRDFTGKIKVLIEGDSTSKYKNVDESFEVANRLDPDKYEIIYLSYNGKPKDWYKVDKFYNKVPHNDVGKIYQEADILLKSSYLESFSYPPLEMMATGGVSVVVPNCGNMEYLKDGENCLLYEKGNIDEAVQKIESLVNDKNLREKIIKGGFDTSKMYDWNVIEKDILDLYK